MRVMEWWILSKALNDISRRKIRSALTILGIFVGVAGIVAIVATATNLTEAQRYNVANSSQADLRWIVSNNPPTLKPLLEQLPNVAAVERRGVYSTKFRGDEQWRDIDFYAYEDYSNIQVNQIDFVEGRPPGSGEIAFEISTRSLLPALKIGDFIIYRGGSDNREHQLMVSGFARSPAYPNASLLQTASAFVNQSEMQRMLGTKGFNEILVRLNDFAGKDETRRQIEDSFKKRNLQFGSFVARDPETYLGKNELDILLTLLLVFSVLGLVISGFLVANTLSAIVTEQMGEIGALKAIGASSRQILQLYLIEGLLYGLAGTILGVLAGFAGGKILLEFLGNMLNFQVEGFLFQWNALVLGFVVGILVSVVATLLPAWRGTTIPVREALDSYGISNSFGKSWVDRLLTRLRIFPPLVAMALRNLTRRKARNLVTFGVISLSCAAFLASQSTSASVDKTAESFYRLYLTDAWVSFDTGRLGNQFAASLRTVEGVELAEPWSKSRGIISASSTDVFGVLPDTQIYRKSILSGRWFNNGENGVVAISNVLAAAKNIKLNDIIQLEINRKLYRYNVIGILDDSTRYLTSNALGKVFMPLDEAERVMGHQAQADYFTITTTQKDPAFVDQTLRTIEQRFRTLQPTTITAYSDRQIIEQISQSLKLLLYAMVVLIALVGTLGVVNTITLNVLERRREIGVLRSLGASDRSMVQLFLTEGLFLGVLGFFAGALLGYPLARLIVNLISQATFPIEFLFDWQIVLFTFIFALVLSGSASLIPALGAARVKTGVILRYG